MHSSKIPAFSGRGFFWEIFVCATLCYKEDIMKDETKVFETLDTLGDAMMESLRNICSIPAISPDGGGTGENRKARAIEEMVQDLGFPKPRRYDAEDSRVEGGLRPNLVLQVPGAGKERLWFVSHMDVVPEGDRSLWKTDPFEPVIQEDRIIGRGVNDNGQELVASLYALYALRQEGIEPSREICLCFVADEEVGSRYGIQHLLEEGLFRKEDLVLVPDGGSEEGDFVEVAEKSILWLQITVEGEQAHASRPDEGNNACREANILAVTLDEALHKAFPERNELFAPACSTFEPTKRGANVGNVNTIPGKEVFCFDCRVLPEAPLDEVLRVVDEVLESRRHISGCAITREILQRDDAAPGTDPEAPVVTLLGEAIRKVFSRKPRVGGIGGGTCAAYFRHGGIPAAVWGQEANCAHQPNEYALKEHLLNEAKVFALMMCAPSEK